MAVTVPFYILLVKYRHDTGKFALIFISLFFYSYWLPIYLPILLISVVFNFLIIKNLKKLNHYVNERIIITIAICVNLLILCYFKYSNFFIENISYITGWNGPVFRIALPLGISFFTFQQIAFLISFYRKEIKKINFYDYLLFISFFPQLIAGPIVSHKDFFPQIKKIKLWTIKSYNFNLGFFLFSLGLFKKSVLIDPYTSYIDVLFAHAADGISLNFIDSWTAALGYSFQIYFDFSGYSDMALGLALVFGIRLPYNFFSPYKSTSIQEFWRRWHITLSTFLRDYLYIPLGGNKHGKFRTLLALLITMFLGGLWHGAGWTFIIWGLFHGSLLIIYYWWVILTKPIKTLVVLKNTATYKASSILATFLLVSVGWVFFRASDLPTAFRIINGMIGLNSAQQITELTKVIILAFPIYFIIIWALPNSIEIMKKYNVSSSKHKFNTHKLSIYKNILCFRMTPIWGFISIGLFIASWFSLSSLSPFIYFQF